MEIVLDALPKTPSALPAPQAPLSAKKKKKRKAGRIAALCVSAFFVLFAASVFGVITHNWQQEIRTCETRNPYITPYGKTLVSAHRSGGGIFPENTMMAFQECVASASFRTDIFEFDLHITKDGQLILLHDDTLDRTTNSLAVFGEQNARPENYTLEQLRRLNFGAGFTDAAGNRPYADLPSDAVPENLRAATLSEVLRFLESSGSFRYIIEIKNKGALGYAAADGLYTVLKELGLLEKCIVGTFNGDVTRYLDEAHPDLLRSASIREVIGFYLDALFGRTVKEGRYKFVALQIPANQFIIKLGNAKITNWAHANDIAVQYWTINDPADIRALKLINADCVMSDVPDIAYEVLNEN